MERREFRIRIPWPTVRFPRLNARRLLPSPGNVLFTLLMIALLLWAQTAGAIPLPATPNAPASSTGAIAYQGRLADAALPTQSSAFTTSRPAAQRYGPGTMSS